MAPKNQSKASPLVSNQRLWMASLARLSVLCVTARMAAGLSQYFSVSGKSSSHSLLPQAFTFCLVRP